MMNRKDVENPWLFKRIREVQTQPDGFLDLWARGHYKSTIITYAQTIQDILASHGEDPLDKWNGLEPTFCIFSHTRPIAKGFLRQIKYEFEQNDRLIELFPDILFPNPDSQSPKWSEDQGIIVIRKSNPKEATVEAWGLVDGQPISRHYSVLIYDDVVVRASVNTPDMIKKTTEMMELSYNLGSTDTIMRGIGTRYHYADTYRDLMKRKTFIERRHTGTEDGTLTGEPVFLTKEQWKKKVEDMGPATAAAQLLQDPKKGSQDGFKREWVMKYGSAPPRYWQSMNRVILVDPANEKKKDSDYTAIGVFGLNTDNNYYLLDGIRDRLNLAERTERLFELHKKWKRPKVGYEKYGKDSDVEHIQHVMKEENYRFDIQELGGKLKKTDRIKRLIPIFSNKRMWIPNDLWKTLYDGKVVDLMETFIEEELMPFPVPVHDDFLDMMSRLFDVQVSWPKQVERKPDRYRDRPRRSFMSV
jgi:predicted phage terminase large subunit-like protein